MHLLTLLHGAGPGFFQIKGEGELRGSWDLVSRVISL